MITESKFYMTNYEHFMMTLEQKNNMHNRAQYSIYIASTGKNNACS